MKAALAPQKIIVASLFSFSLALALAGSGCGASAPEVQREEPELPVQSQSGRLMFALPMCPTRYGGAGTIVWEREMVITDLSVVEDPCRTRWDGTACAPGTVGVWTFGNLLMQMAGNNAALANTMVSDWLNSWTDPDLRINGHLLNETRVSWPDRSMPQPVNKFAETVILPWRSASGCMDPAKPCSYDLKKAPFRLLAIVNRLDLAGAGYGGDRTGTQSNGEGRFVFGFLNLNDPQLGTPSERPLRATLIMEYRLSPAVMPPTFWAREWHLLSGMPFGTNYNTQLQSITDLFTRAGGDPQGPNGGSAISQVRTNERDLDSVTGSTQLWELREQTLLAAPNAPCTPRMTDCRLLPTTVKQTPANRHNQSALLANYVEAKKEEIETQNHRIPEMYLGQSMLGAVSRFTTNVGSDMLNVWQLPMNETHPETRLTLANLAIATCNGCHYRETNTQGFHIEPRKVKTASVPSSFLSNPSTTSITDPRTYIINEMSVNETYQYKEQERRLCEIRRLLTYPSDPPVSTLTGAPRTH